MSEPAQLFVRVPVTEAAYQAFRRAPPPLADAALGWEAWLGSQRYYGPPITFADLRDKHCRYQAATIDGCLRAWTRADDSRRARDRYDAARREWHYLLVDFTDNYGDYAQVLNVVQHLARFKDSPEPGYALVFHHVWGHDAVSALLRIDAGSASFVGSETNEARELVLYAAKAVERATALFGWFGR